MKRAVPVALALLLAACGAGAGPAPAPAQTGGPPDVLEYFDQCEVGVAPDDACLAATRDPASAEVALAVAIAERYMDLYPAIDHPWDWSEAVLMFALTELSRVTGDPAPRDYARTWLEHRIEKGYDIWLSDRCPPALTAIALWREDGGALWEAVVQDLLTYVAEVAPRTEDGGLGHLGTLDPDQPSLWADSLMMVGMPLLRWAEAAADDAALAEAALQSAVFADHLQGAGGFYTHAWNWYSEQDPGLYWARGNGWVMVFLHELLRLRRLRGEADAATEASASALTAAALAVQDPESGLWWGLLSHPGDLYLETSASALFTYGLARGYRYGFRDDAALPAIAAAVEGLLTRVVEDPGGRPMVTGVSGPTSVGVYADYAGVGLEDDVPFGVGAMILALTEASGLPLAR